MKPFLRLLLTVSIAGTFATSLSAQMSDREFKRFDAGKITNAEAQHLVMKRYPDAKLKKTTLRKQGNHSVFVVEIVRPGRSGMMKVEVDGRTGKLSTPAPTR